MGDKPRSGRRGRITGRWLSGDGDRRRLATLVDASEEAIVSVDRDGVVETWNRAAEALFGRTREEAIGAPFDVLESPALTDRPGAAYETRLPHHGGGLVDLAVRVSTLVEDGPEPVGWIVIARDITEQRRGAAVLEAAVADRTARLQEAIEAREAAELETVARLSRAVEFRDADTGLHVGRIAELSAHLAERAGLRPRRRDLLRTASVLHDVGKVAIPDAVLLKPGGLTAQERALVETHAQIGHDLLTDSRSPLLRLAADIALTHHERWDGTGYPRGLTASEIPLEGRIVAIVDVYDALTRDRVYRNAFPEAEARAMMAEQRGRQFDPELLDLFSSMA